MSPVSRLSAWLRGTFAMPAPLVWAGAAAMLALAVVTAGNLGRTPLNDIEVAGSGETYNAAFVLVTFKPDARLADIAALLKASGAKIGGWSKRGGRVQDQCFGGDDCGL